MNDMYKHQLEGVSFLIRNNGGYLAYSCGLGKTRIVIEAFKAWKAQGMKLMVICPLSLINTAWRDDLKKFAPELIMSDLHSTKRRDNADVYVVNYEALVSQKRYAEIVALVTKYKFACCLDEVSMVSNPTAKRTKALLNLRNSFKVKVALSGTPCSQSDTQWWAPVTFLRDGVLQSSFYGFRNSYFHLARGKAKMERPAPSIVGNLLQTGWKWDITQHRREQLLTRIKPLVLWKKLEECVDMPEEIDQIREVELDADLRKAYDSMKRACVAEIKGQQIEANMALTKIGKLRQITGGFAIAPDGVVSRHPVQDKIEELVSVTKELGDAQAVIFFNYVAEGADIKARFGEDVVIVDGSTTDKTSAINDFKAGRYRYLAANIASLAHGVTLVNANYTIYYSHSYSAEDFAQSRARIRRIGQHKPCVYIHLLAKDTIDETIYNVLQKKGKAVEIVEMFMRS